MELTNLKSRFIFPLNLIISRVDQINLWSTHKYYFFECLLCEFFILVLWTELCPLKISVEVLTFNVTIFGDRNFEEVIKIKESHKVEALIQYDWPPCKKRKTHQRCAYTEKRAGKNTERWGHLQARERGLRKNETCWNLSLGLPVSRMVSK